MAQPRRRAKFFLTVDGIAIPKAKPLTGSEKMAIYDRDGIACRMCGAETSRGGPYQWGQATGVIDHIIPRCRGGQNNPSNLQVLCYSCNAAKGSK